MDWITADKIISSRRRRELATAAVLFLLSAGLFLGLNSVPDNPTTAAKACSILLLVVSALSFLGMTKTAIGIAMVPALNALFALAIGKFSVIFGTGGLLLWLAGLLVLLRAHSSGRSIAQPTHPPASKTTCDGCGKSYPSGFYLEKSTSGQYLCESCRMAKSDATMT